MNECPHEFPDVTLYRIVLLMTPIIMYSLTCFHPEYQAPLVCYATVLTVVVPFRYLMLSKNAENLTASICYDESCLQILTIIV